MEFVPDRPLELDLKLFTNYLQNAPSGCAPGPGGCTNEMLRTCLDDSEVFQLLFRAAEDCASASMPETVRRAFMSASKTALQKPDGGVRGIATGTSFRRLVARTLARQFGKAVEATCAPFQFALSTRAGTDCVGHAIRAVTNTNPMCTVLSIDGTMCTEAPCWQSCTRFLAKGCFRSSELPMPTPRVTFGKMRLGCNTASSKPKGANKATL